MKICFDKTEDSEKLLEQLSLKKPSLEENKLCFPEEQIQKAGLNLEIFKILADEYGQDVSRFLAFPVKTPGKKIRFSSYHTKLLKQAIEQSSSSSNFAEDLAEFQRLTSPTTSCWAQSQQSLAFFLRYQLLGWPIPSWDNYSKGYGVQVSCPYEAPLHSLMRGGIFLMDQLPEPIRTQGQSSTILILQQDPSNPNQFSPLGSGVVIDSSEQTLHLLTNRHVLYKIDEHGEIEKDQNQQPKTRGIFIRLNNGHMVSLKEAISHDFGADLMLVFLKGKSVGKHPFVAVNSLPLRSGTEVFSLGYSASGASDIYSIQDLAKLAKENVKNKELNSLAGKPLLTGSVGRAFTPRVFQLNPYDKEEPYTFYTNAPVLPVWSGGPIFQRVGQQLYVVGINKKAFVDAKKNEENAYHYTYNYSKGVDLSPFAMQLTLQIHLDKAKAEKELSTSPQR